MKKFFVSLVAIFISVTLTGQNTNEKVFPKSGKIPVMNAPVNNANNFDLFHINKIPDKILPIHSQRNRISKATDVTVIKQRLDSLVRQSWSNVTNSMVNSSKSEYAYDVYGNLILSASYNWDVANSRWIGVDKYEFMFDNSGNTNLETTYYTWKPTLNQWEANYKHQYTYNDNSKMTSDLLTYWESTWLTSTKEVYTYDTEGNTTSRASYYWDSYLNKLEERNKTEYTYATNGTRLNSIDSWRSSGTGDWMMQSKTEYSYDKNKNNTLKIAYLWDSDHWNSNFKEEYTYDTAGKNTLYINYNDNGGAWQAAVKDIYNYDATGNLTQDSQYDWNLGTNQWEISRQNDYAFDSEGNNTIGIISNKRNTNNVFMKESKYEYFYDYNYSIKEILSGGLLESSKCKNMVTHATMYTYDGTGWKIAITSNVFYSAFNILSEVKTLSAESIRIYPNPASKFITLQSDNAEDQFTFELYNLQGKKVLNQVIKNNTPVSVETLPKGFYLYSIFDNGKMQNGKLIIK